MQTQVASTPDTLLELNRDYIRSVREADVQRFKTTFTTLDWRAGSGRHT